VRIRGDLAGERRHLALAWRLARRVEQPGAVTGLLAHSVPDAFTADAWVDEVAHELAGLRDSVVALDVFVESFAFGNEHLARMGALAATHGLALRAHV
jgi:imidazolonepropionase-like amidohydrolase